jgi:hypothetical protein
MIEFGITLRPDPPSSRLVELMRMAEAQGFSYGWLFDFRHRRCDLSLLRDWLGCTVPRTHLAVGRHWCQRIQHLFDD